MTARKLFARLLIIAGLLSLVACTRSCSLFTEIESDDAGDVSFVRQVVPKLLGRKIRGYEETRLLRDVIVAVPDNKGREELLAALMQNPEFASHWSENLVDMLRVNRIGAKNQSSCFRTPLRGAPDAGIAQFILNQPADLSGFGGSPPAAFNMADVLQASFALDNLFPVYSSYLFAMQNKPLTGNMTTELNRRDDFGNAFEHVYTNRKIECLPCHNSSFSTSGPQTYWQRTFPIWGRFEAAVYESESGGDHNRANAFFRTGVNVPPPGSDADDSSSATIKTPWGNLQSCGTFREQAAGVDRHGVVPYFTASFPVGAAIWDMQRLLNDGRQTLVSDGLVRSLPAACDICSDPSCTTGVTPPPDTAETNAVRTLFSGNRCFNCHSSPGAAANLDLEINTPLHQWTNNLIDVTVDFDPATGIKRVVRGDPGNSYLINKLTGSLHPSDAGQQMPRGGPFLSNAQIDIVRNWITNLPGPTIPPACAVCTSSTCTDTPREVEGEPAFAYLVGLNVTNQVWQEIMGYPLTIANKFPRTQDQMRVHWYLTEFTFLANDWSPRELTKRIMLSKYFNRKAPKLASAATAYDVPLVLDPWVEADPRQPPVAQPGWTAGTPPTPDPAYDPEVNPQNHNNAMSESVHRYSPRSLFYSAHKALGWPAPDRFYLGTAYPQQELGKAVGQFFRDSEPGFRDTDFNGLLQWESAHKTCTNPAGGTDWVTRLLDAIAAHNTANPGSQITLEQAIIIMKDWLISDPSISTDVLTHDDGRREDEILQTFFGTATLNTVADVSTPALRSALEGKLRNYCGVLTQSPQFWLAGIAPTDLGTAPALRVCNDPAVCSYRQMCDELNTYFTAAGSDWVLRCDNDPVTVAPRPVPGPTPIPPGLRDLCRNRVCGFMPRPGITECFATAVNPILCFPHEPPPCDLPCARVDCCGGPLPPLQPDRKLRPSIIMGWFEDGIVKDVEGVRVQFANDRRSGKWVPLEKGTRLTVGDVLELPVESALEVKGSRGTFETPKGGMPANPSTKSQHWYLMVTGPTALERDLHPMSPMHWQMSSEGRKAIEQQNRRRRTQTRVPGHQIKHDPELRLSNKVRVPEQDAPPVTKPPVTKQSPQQEQPLRQTPQQDKQSIEQAPRQ